MSMTDKTKTEVIDFLFDCMFSSMFGDGLEEMYIRDGMNFKGLNNMSDKELLRELLNYTGHEEELVIRVQQEIEVEKLLKGDG